MIDEGRIEYKPIFNEQKATEAAATLIELEGGEMNYMKLIKLLYLMDKMALRQWERPITYDRYFSMKDGQVLSKVLDFVKDKITGVIWHNYIGRSGQYTVSLTRGPVKPSLLSPAELALIRDMYADLGQYDQFRLGRITKRGSEYKKTNSRIETPLESLLSDLKFSEDDIRDIKENLRERADIELLFGA